jgi:hypothetical protein
MVIGILNGKDQPCEHRVLLRIVPERGNRERSGAHSLWRHAEFVSAPADTLTLKQVQSAGRMVERLT